MSVGEMSATLQNKIAVSIEKAITNNGKLLLSERNQLAHLNYSSQDSIRGSTDAASSKHESIMSRGGLASLKSTMLDYYAENASSSLTSDIINNLNLDDFRDYIISEYTNNASLKNASNRTDPNFTYSSPIKLAGTSTRLIVGTNTQGDMDRDLLILKNIPHGKLVTLFTEYIQKTAEVPKELEKSFFKEIKALFNAGHLTGVFTGRLIRTFGVQNRANSTFTVAGKDADVGALVQNAIDLVTAADYLSSTIYADPELFLRTDKRLFQNSSEIRLTTEVQFARSTSTTKGNQEVGTMLATAGRHLSNVIKAVKAQSSQKGRDIAAGDAVTKLFKELEKINAYVKDRQAEVRQNDIISKELTKALNNVLVTTETFERLISSKGSDSLIDHSIKQVLNILDPKIKISTGTSIASIKKPLNKIRTSSDKPDKVSLPKSKSTTVTISSLSATPVQGSKVNLSSLLALINSNLQHVISANMGGGTERNVLNYRSGRFAASARVDRLSESRAGMITAFYSYMKNPYQTFEPGFAQGSPASRNPKNLIGTSIREIAATKVSNQLRAISI